LAALPWRVTVAMAVVAALSALVAGLLLWTLT
jgi:hypothetical protein